MMEGMVEGTGPEFHIKVHTKKKRPDDICKCVVSTFDRTILARVA